MELLGGGSGEGSVLTGGQTRVGGGGEVQWCWGGRSLRERTVLPEFCVFGREFYAKTSAASEILFLILKCIDAPRIGLRARTTTGDTSHPNSRLF